MEDTLIIKKQEIVSWIAENKEKYRKRAERAYQASETCKKREKAIYLEKAREYSCTSERFSIMLNWLVNGKFYSPGYSGGYDMPPTYYDIVNSGVEINDAILNILESRMFADYIIWKDSQKEKDKTK